MARISMNVYAKAKAIELTDWKPLFKSADPYKSRQKTIKERRNYKVAGVSPNPYSHTRKVTFMQRSFVDAENTGYVYEKPEPKINDGKRTIFITINKNKIIVQK